MPIATQAPDNPGIARTDMSAIAIDAEFLEDCLQFSSDEGRGFLDQSNGAIVQHVAFGGYKTRF